MLDKKLGGRVELIKPYNIRGAASIMPEHDFGAVLRRWRKGAGIKQQALGDILGVSQATISRWEAGIDRPAQHTHGRLQEFIGKQRLTEMPAEQRIISRQIGIRALVDLDGMKLLATTQDFKSIWPELALCEGHKLADDLIGLSAEIYSDESLLRNIRRGEVTFIAGVSDRHLSGYGTNAFRHYWSAVYRTSGTRHYAEVSFEQCDPLSDLGLLHILRTDEIE